MTIIAIQNYYKFPYLSVFYKNNIINSNAFKTELLTTQFFILYLKYWSTVKFYQSISIE